MPLGNFRLKYMRASTVCLLATAYMKEATEDKQTDTLLKLTMTLTVTVTVQ